MLWLKLLSFNASQGVVEFGNGNTDSISLRFDTRLYKKEKLIVFETCFKYGCYWIELESFYDNFVNKWNHYTSVYKADSGEVEMYLNGCTKRTWKMKIDNNDIHSFKKVLRSDNYIGTITYNDDFQNLHAKVNDLKIFDRPLKKIQIKKEMSADLGKMIELSVRN